MALGTIVFFQGDFERSQDLLGESAALARAAGEPAIVALALGLSTRGRARTWRHGRRGAASRDRFGGSISRRTVARRSRVVVLRLSGVVCRRHRPRRGDTAGHARRRPRAGRSVGTGPSCCTTWRCCVCCRNRCAEARSLSREAMSLGQQFGDRRAIAWCLGLFACAEAAEGRFVRAARLRGAMEGNSTASAPPCNRRSTC